MLSFRYDDVAAHNRRPRWNRAGNANYDRGLPLDPRACLACRRPGKKENVDALASLSAAKRERSTPIAGRVSRYGDRFTLDVWNRVSMTIDPKPRRVNARLSLSLSFSLSHRGALARDSIETG